MTGPELGDQVKAQVFGKVLMLEDQINPTPVGNALDILAEAAGERLRLTFSFGLTLSGQEDEALLDAAADVAVVFLGLPEGEESEGFDREHIDLPDVQLRLLEAVARSNRNTVVVLANGGAVRISDGDHHVRIADGRPRRGEGGAGAEAAHLSRAPADHRPNSAWNSRKRGRNPTVPEASPSFLRLGGDRGNSRSVDAAAARQIQVYSASGVEGRAKADGRAARQGELFLQFARKGIVERLAPRSAIRRALDALEQEGLIVRQVGRGTFLTEAAVPVVEPLPADTSPAEIMQVRLLIEPPAAALAARVTTQADLDRITHCLDHGGRSDDQQDFETWDTRLHHAIAQAAHNGLMMSMFDVMNTARDLPIWGGLKRRTATPERLCCYHSEHTAIVEALRDRDPKSARTAMHHHLEHVADTLLGRH